jgi:hypothetical protein
MKLRPWSSITLLTQIIAATFSIYCPTLTPKKMYGLSGYCVPSYLSNWTSSWSCHFMASIFVIKSYVEPLCLGLVMDLDTIFSRVSFKSYILLICNRFSSQLSCMTIYISLTASLSIHWPSHSIIIHSGHTI